MSDSIENTVSAPVSTPVETTSVVTTPNSDFNMTEALAKMSENIAESFPGTKIEGNPDTIGTDVPPVPPVTAPTDPAAAVPPAINPLDTAPATWTVDEAASWKTLPETVRTTIARREAEFTAKQVSDKVFVDRAQAFDQVIAPYANIFAQHNLDPLKNVAGLLQSHHTLSYGTYDQKVALVQQIIRDYGIVAPSPVDPLEDPKVTELRHAYQQEQLRNQQFQQQQEFGQQQAQKQQALRHIEMFAADPQHKHFDAVIPQMEILFRGQPNMSLQDAYAQAIYMNPTVRALVQIEQATAAKLATDKSNAEKAAQAKQATAVNLKIVPKEGTQLSSGTSMQDTAADVYAQIMARG